MKARKRAVVWAIAGGCALTAALIVAAILAITSPAEPPAAEHVESEAPTPTSTPSATSAREAVVDESVVALGWVAEPVTQDSEVYLRAAIEAAGTVDTARASRDQWITHLESWFTLDPRFTDPAEQTAQLNRYKLTMRDAVIFPTQLWDSLASQDGRVVAAVIGEMVLTPVPDYDGDDMFIGTSDVVLTFSQIDEAGAEYSYDENVRVSAQVLCGAVSLPTPGSAQAAGDCKLIRYFDEALGD